MTRTRTVFVEELGRLESRSLEGLDLAADSLRRALRALEQRDLALARRLVADDDRIDRRYVEVTTGIVELLATEAPVATDLRLTTALLQVIGHVERMGDQCVNLAKMLLLAGETPVDPALLMGLQRMGTLVLSEIVGARHAFALRDPELAAVVASDQETVDSLDREVFARASQAGTDVGIALSAALMARALARIGHNAVAVAQLGAFVVTARLRPRGGLALG
jgi:phosphate transport system protein